MEIAHLLKHTRRHLLPNVLSLRAKASELLTKVFSFNSHVHCLPEIWLNHSCFNHSLFPETYFIIQLRGSATRNHVEVPYLLYLIMSRVLYVELSSNWLTNVFGLKYLVLSA